MMKRLSSLVLGSALVMGSVGAFAAPRHHADDPRLSNDVSHDVSRDHAVYEHGQRERHHRGHHQRRWWAQRRHHADHWRGDTGARYQRTRRHGAPHRYDAGCREVTLVRRDHHGRPYEVRQSACRDRHGDLVVRDRSVGRLRF